MVNLKIQSNEKKNFFYLFSIEFPFFGDVSIFDELAGEGVQSIGSLVQLFHAVERKSVHGAPDKGRIRLKYVHVNILKV